MTLHRYQDKVFTLSSPQHDHSFIDNILRPDGSHMVLYRLVRNIQAFRLHQSPSRSYAWHEWMSKTMEEGS